MSIFIVNCNDSEFLDEIPVSSITVKSFFKTQKQFEEAVNGAYTNLKPLAGSGNLTGCLWLFEEMRSDNTTFQENTVDRSIYDFGYPALDMFTLGAQNTYLMNVAWNNCYEGIGKCNIVLDKSEGTDFELTDRYIAEVKFLRALYYLYLVQWFGDVPLVTTPVNSYEEAFEKNKRIPENLIYEQIINDLNDAKEDLPQYYLADDWGRATSGAARTLLAEVLMRQNKYGEAATELEEVFESKRYTLLNDYSSVFDINNEQNEEIIFSVRSIEGPYGLGSRYMYDFTPWNAETRYLPHPQYLARTGLNIPTEDLINSFEEGDLRLSMIDTTFIDHVTGTYHDSIVPFTRKFWDPTHSVQGVTGNDFPLLRYPHVLLMLAECYLRVGGGDPLPLVNQVRQRAGLHLLSSVTLDDIIHERRIEFHCEADRWQVLVRTGKVIETMTRHGQEEKTKRPTVITGNAYNQIRIFLPIPTAVLENDPSMEQNPEYK